MRGESSSSIRQPAEKEKQRRDRMKGLYSTLATLLHLQPSVGRKSLLKLLDEATSALKELKEKVERLKCRKEELENEVDAKEQVLVQVREVDLKLEANLIITTMKPFQILKVIEESGADQIINSTFCIHGHRIYCTIHAQASQARVGFDAEEIESRLMELVTN